MTIDQIISSLDSEIARLQTARAALSTVTTTDAAKPPARRRRKLSAAARKKIAEAQRKRWAKQKAAN